MSDGHGMHGGDAAAAAVVPGSLAPVGDMSSVRAAGRTALMVGGVAVILCLVGAVWNYQSFIRSYLWAYLFWIGLSLGSLCVTMILNLTGGAWGYAIRRIVEAAVRTIPLMALLFLPILFGVHSLYDWSVHPEKLGVHKHQWLTVPGWTGRAIICFVFWLSWGFMTDRWSRRNDRTGDLLSPMPLQRLSGVGILLWALSITILAFDWILSLNTGWYSTMYGVIIMVGEVLSTLSFSVLVLTSLRERDPLRSAVSPDHFNDLGSLMFGFTILWAYTSFAQFLITWTGDQHEEITWYHDRMSSGWVVIGELLMAVAFFSPFILLLMRPIKRNPRILSVVAMVIIAMRFTDLYWIIKPSFPAGMRVAWTDLVTPFAVGGLWLWWFCNQLTMRPLLPPRNPELEGYRHKHHEEHGSEGDGHADAGHGLSPATGH